MAKTTVRKPSTKVNSKTKPKPRPGKTSSSPRSKPAASKSKVKKPPPRQQKPKPLPVPVKKRPTYSEQQLGIPKLNMITPIGVQKSRGKKKGKIFVDDRVCCQSNRTSVFVLRQVVADQALQQESMMTILAMVNADKEGHLESKMMKAVRRVRSLTSRLYMLIHLLCIRDSLRKSGKLDGINKRRNRKLKSLSW